MIFCYNYGLKCHWFETWFLNYLKNDVSNGNFFITKDKNSYYFIFDRNIK